MSSSRRCGRSAQNVRQLFRISDRVYGLKVGRVVVEGTPTDLDASRLCDLF